MARYRFRRPRLDDARRVRRANGRPRGASDDACPNRAFRVDWAIVIDIISRFADHLRQCRLDAGVSVAELASAMNVSASTLHGVESGRKMPTTPTLVAMSIALRVPLDHLMPQGIE